MHLMAVELHALEGDLLDVAKLEAIAPIPKVTRGKPTRAPTATEKRGKSSTKSGGKPKKKR